MAFPGALHLWEAEFLLGRPPTPARPWTVVTTVRDPVAQAVSAFFHAGRGRAAFDGATVASLNEEFDAEDWIRRPAAVVRP